MNLLDRIANLEARVNNIESKYLDKTKTSVPSDNNLPIQQSYDFDFTAMWRGESPYESLIVDSHV